MHEIGKGAKFNYSIKFKYLILILNYIEYTCIKLVHILCSFWLRTGGGAIIPSYHCIAGTLDENI